MVKAELEGLTQYWEEAKCSCISIQNWSRVVLIHRSFLNVPSAPAYHYPLTQRNPGVYSLLAQILQFKFHSCMRSPF